MPPPPPKPQPLQLNDDFENTAVGSAPEKAHLSGEEHGASIRISDERAADGRHSLKVTDSKTLRPSWQPHFYYEPHFVSGTLRQSFEVWLGTNAQFFTEWRDTAEYPHNVGPSVRFDGNGEVSVSGRVLARMPVEEWFRVEIEAAIGKNAARGFKLTLTPTSTASQTFPDLPISGKDFHEVHWLGFSSTAAADTAFYLDNLRLSRHR